MDPKVEMLKSLGNADPVVAYKAYYSLEMAALAFTAPGRTAVREEMATFLAGELNATDPGGKDAQGKNKPPVPRYTIAVRRQIIQLLGYVGGAAEVPALAAALKNLELREAARCALEVNPSAEATDALLAALDDVGPEFRVGVVNALGTRGGEKVVKALQGLVNDEDREVRIAAAYALARIGDAGSDATLVALSKQECRLTRQAAHRARVRLADTLARRGDTVTARKIYQDIRHSEAGEPQKKAAEIALAAMR
ncbi:MAG TPA: HEAT repeat domain-containing protein [Phycisphaerae bacterium]|nr:HEAT repeat domain-containing protein [Phycisphaerae bacterium]HOJ75935.1 HEAT repeat domain-containing protein [Phycisphaerae bacterium]HOM53390.1 HEAT repeat domain-containing protein [Phycisphaerae bacterium]HOQ84476.1 HEAT repeat domain-containing protein [Phycisphaerae bacterium]HPP28516.1 HEAT repeat domain-containing protein [Phycisphaerae bacterium]